MTDANGPMATVIPICPICGDTMELVHDQPAMKVCICSGCHTGLHVPIRAWDMLRPTPRPAGPRVVRPESDKATGQAPPEEIDDRPSTGDGPPGER